MAAKREAAKRHEDARELALRWGYELFTATDGSRLLTSSLATKYRAVLADLEGADVVTLTAERLAVARQAVSAALSFEEEIKERDWRMMRALHGAGSEMRRLRAMRREFLGQDGRGRGAVIDIATAVRDWRLMTEPAPFVDADGCTWLARHLGFFGLVPECTRHGRPGAAGATARERGRCEACRAWTTPAAAKALTNLAQARHTDSRLLAVQALRHVHGFSSDGAVVQALTRAGVRGLPAVRWRDKLK